MKNAFVRKNDATGEASSERTSPKEISPFYHKLMFGGAIMLMAASFAFGMTGCAKKPAPKPKPAAGAEHKSQKESGVKRLGLFQGKRISRPKTKTAEALGTKQKDKQDVSAQQTVRFLQQILGNKQVLLMFEGLSIGDVKDKYGETGGFLVITLNKKGLIEVNPIVFENTESKEALALLGKLYSGDISLEEFKTLLRLTEKYVDKRGGKEAEIFDETNRKLLKGIETDSDYFKEMPEANREKIAELWKKVLQPFIDTRIPASPQEIKRVMGKVNESLKSVGGNAAVFMFHIHADGQPPSSDDLIGSKEMAGKLSGSIVVSYKEREKTMTFYLLSDGKNYSVGTFNPLKIKPEKKEEGWLLRMRDWFLEHRKKE